MPSIRQRFHLSPCSDFRSHFCERLCDTDLANSHAVQAEYLELLQAVFPSLADDCKTKFLAMLQLGPNIDGAREGVDTDFYSRRWLWQMLGAIKVELPPGLSGEWTSLSAEFGAELEIRRQGITSGWVGRPQAVGVDRLSEMTPDGIVSLLGAFESGDGFGAPSTEDLGRELAQAVALDSNRFAKALGEFDGVDLTYKASLIRGFRDAAEVNQMTEWEPVLDFCQKIGSEAGLRTEAVSENARREIIDLLNSGLAPKGNEIPLAQRDRVWALLEVLQDDPNPVPSTEGQYTGLGPYEIAINTNRGRAIEAAILYGVWVYRVTKVQMKGTRPFNFEEVPELPAVLERHLDVSIDESLAVRSVYGAYLSTLVGLDREWFVAHLDNLFPQADSDAQFRQVVWDAYVSYARLNLSMLDVLRAEYEKSVDIMASRKFEQRHKPDERLGQHLLVFYWHGKLDLDDDLILKFFDNASDEVRGAVMANLGQDLRQNSDILPDEMETRLKLLWEKRVQNARQGLDSHKQEMASFGWTFASGRLGDAWALQQLLEVLDIAGEVVLDHEVAERLGVIAPKFPSEALQCLSLMIDGSKEDWQIHKWGSAVETVLQVALESGDGTTRLAGAALINRLGARGFLQFRHLLKDG